MASRSGIERVAFGRGQTLGIYWAARPHFDRLRATSPIDRRSRDDAPRLPFIVRLTAGANGTELAWREAGGPFAAEGRLKR